MSGTTQGDSNSQSENYFQLIADFENVILKSSELLDTTLEENLTNASHTISRYGLLRSVESALRTETDDERVHDLSHAIMSIISSDPLEVVDQLRETDANKELIKILLGFASKYGLESGIPGRVSRQGPNYWNDIQIDILRRGRSGAVGMNYRLIVGRSSDSKEISLSLDSNIVLIMNMLAAQEHAIEEFEEDAIDQMDLSMISNLQEQVEDIEDLVDNYVAEERSEQDDN
jgi:hypothetical protein